MSKRKPPPKPCTFAGCVNLHMAKGLCVSHYSQLSKTGRMWPITPATRRGSTSTVCNVEGCDKPRKGKRLVCYMHASRLEKFGSLELPPQPEPAYLCGGYVRKPAPGHPLAAKDNGLFDHRRVLFEVLGWEPTPCAWCGRMLTWRAERQADRLEVDHFNEIKTDNHPANLLPSCRSCNSARAVQMKTFIKAATAA